MDGSASVQGIRQSAVRGPTVPPGGRPVAAVRGVSGEGRWWLKHAGHVISKALVGGEARYIVWRGDRMLLPVYTTVDEARARAEVG